MECLDKSPVVHEGETFVTKYGDIRLIQVLSNSAGIIGVKLIGQSEITREMVDKQLGQFGDITVKCNFFTLAGKGAHFWVCGPSTIVDPIISNGGSTLQLKIKGKEGMRGFVDLVENKGWLWHITEPIQLDIWFGLPGMVPGTYVDTQGNDQMAMISDTVVHLDQNYSGGIGEEDIPIKDVTIQNVGDNITKRVSIGADNTLLIAGLIVAIIGVMMMG